MSGIQRILLAGNSDKRASDFADGIVAGYRSAILAAGGSISATQLAAVKAFVKTGFKDRWWFSLVDCCLFLGADLTSALVKIIAAPGAGTSYVNHGVVSGDYGVNGITVSGNSTKYLGTGIIPINQGLGLNDYSLVAGASVSTPINAQGMWGCDESDTGNIACIGGVPHSQQGNRNHLLQWSRAYSAGIAFMPSRAVGAHDGIRIMDSAVNSSTGSLNTEIEIFRTTKFGVRYIANSASIGFFAVGRMMTMVQVQSITAAMLRLHRSARSIALPVRYMYMGDSITHGQGVTSDTSYPVMVANARSSEATCIAVTGSSMFTDGATVLAGRNRYKGTETFPIGKFFCMLGSNDIGIQDVTTNGDPAVIAVYRSYLVTMANVLKGQGAQAIILSIPYTTRANQTKLLAWVDGALGAATDAGVIGIDTCRPMIDTGDPGQFLIDDVHPNATGHAFIRDLILAVI